MVLCMTWSLTLVPFTCSLSEVSNLNSELNMIKDKDGEGKLILTAHDRIEHYTYSTVHLQYSTVQYSTVQYIAYQSKAKHSTAITSNTGVSLIDIELFNFN